MTQSPPDRARALLGKQVRVTLGTENGEAVIATGRLLGLGDGGDFEVRGEDGFVHYCWPMLDIEEVADDDLPLSPEQVVFVKLGLLKVVPVDEVETVCPTCGGTGKPFPGARTACITCDRHDGSSTGSGVASLRGRMVRITVNEEELTEFEFGDWRLVMGRRGWVLVKRTDGPAMGKGVEVWDLPAPGSVVATATVSEVMRIYDDCNQPASEEPFVARTREGLVLVWEGGHDTHADDLSDQLPYADFAPTRPCPECKPEPSGKWGCERCDSRGSVGRYCLILSNVQAVG